MGNPTLLILSTSADITFDLITNHYSLDENSTRLRVMAAVHGAFDIKYDIKIDT